MNSLNKTLKSFVLVALMFAISPAHAFFEVSERKVSNVVKVDPLGCEENLNGRVGPKTIEESFSEISASCQSGNLAVEECQEAAELCVGTALFGSSAASAYACRESYDVEKKVRFLWWKRTVKLKGLFRVSPDNVEEIKNQLEEMGTYCAAIAPVEEQPNL